MKSPKPLKILALDPGRATGWVAVAFDGTPRLVGRGIIDPPADLHQGADAANRLEAYLLPLFRQLARSADELVIEKQVFGIGATNLSAYGAYRAAQRVQEETNAQYFLTQKGAVWGQYAPIAVKNTLFGANSAKHTESEVRQLIQRWTGEWFRPDYGYHQTRALAVACVHLVRTHHWRPDGFRPKPPKERVPADSALARKLKEKMKR